MTESNWDEDAYATLCEKWGKRETWTLKEFLCLLSGADPNDPLKQRDWENSRLQAIDPTEYYERLSILMTCHETLQIPVGAELDEHTLCPKPNLMNIARGYGWRIRPQLERAAQTLLAKKQPDRTRSARLAAIKAFTDDVYRRGRNADYRFASGLQRRPFPVTKKDFIDVFIQQYPEFASSALATLKDDLVEAKIRFASGQKDNPNNVIVKLFEKK